MRRSHSPRNTYRELRMRKAGMHPKVILKTTSGLCAPALKTSPGRSEDLQQTPALWPRSSARVEARLDQHGRVRPRGREERQRGFPCLYPVLFCCEPRKEPACDPEHLAPAPVEHVSKSLLPLCSLSSSANAQGHYSRGVFQP